MALQVWLPLNGNLQNNGLKKVNITAIEATPTYVAGKIGQCYQRANVDTQLTNGLKIDDNFLTTFDTQASVAVWVKPLGTHTHYNGTILSSGNWNTKKWAFGVSQDNSKVDVLCGAYNNYIDCPVPINTWTHLVSTFDNGVCKLYKNGVYIGEKTGQAAFDSDADWTGICRESYASGYFGFNGQINDLRIYDHVLSAKEVKELSKGLVLHYTFTSENIEPPLSIANFSDLTTWNKEGGITVLWDSTANAYKVLDSSHTSSRWGIYKQVTLKANRSYTFSIYGQQVDQVAGYGFAEGNSWPGVASNFTTTRTQYSKTINVGNQNITCRIYLYVYPVSGGTNYGYFDTPVLTESSYQIYDCSGYGHHGIYNGGVNQNVSPRHEQCFHFSDANHYIKIDNLQTTGFGDSYSFAWWAKISSVNPMHWGFSNGIRVNGMYTGRLWNTGDGSNNPLYNIGTTTQVTAPTTGVWHHWVMTGDGTHCYVYQDGVLWAEAKTYKSISGTTLYINGWTADSSYSSNNYSITDFRIYATALSADDIKELYNTPAFIDNKQNLSAYEFIEDDGAEIRKNGVLEGVAFTEDEEVQIANDGQIQSNFLYEI